MKPASTKEQQFDAFVKKTRDGWKFEGIVEATTPYEAKMKAMHSAGITNPNRVSVYLRR